jgi:glycerol-3-phosphate dehydrogenase
MSLDRPTILILGAGINGAAIARELALCGVGVVIVDRCDIASGATAYSSRLIHGGLRYLEYGEFDLVRESLNERTRLLHLAPHLVKPLRLFVPVSSRLSGMRSALPKFFGWQGKPRAPEPRGLWLVNAGLQFYDRLARSSSLPRRKVHRVGAAPAPPVDAKRYRWVCSYWDAQIVYPERFTLALLEDARQLAEAHGAEFRVYTYHEARFQNHLATVRPVPRETARPSHLPQGVKMFTPAAIINATGAWVDQTLKLLGAPSVRIMGGTKGSHILTHQAAIRGALGQSGVYTEASDGRPIFLLPFGEAVLIGTTDLPFENSPETAVANDEEITYLLDAANAVFPYIHLQRGDVTLHYSGVRPLPYVDATTTAAITRRHFLKEHTECAVPLYSIIGGKLTTCRSLAEETVNAVLPRINRAPPMTSRDRPIPGGADYPRNDVELLDIHAQLSERLGYSSSQINAVWQLCGRLIERALSSDLPPAPQPDDRENLPGTSLPKRFVRYTLNHEWVSRLADLVERRLMLHFHREISEACLQQLAHLLVESGQLAIEDLEQEVTVTRQRLADHFGRQGDVIRQSH